MKFELKIFSALCATDKFVINGIEANSEDFGYQSDKSPETAEAYCCGNMVFTRKEPTAEILQKYNITEKEYSDICYELEDKLSFGSCGCCS